MVTPTTGAKTLTFQNLGAVVLRQGDHDKTHVWGGSAKPALTGTPVQDLQNALIAIGTLTFPADGQFGAHTQQAIRRFQWYVTNQRYRLQVAPGSQPSGGKICQYTASAVGTPGVCDAGLASLILSWQSDNFIATTPLVRLDLNPLSNIEKSSTFQALSYPSAQDGEILVNEDFAGSVSGTLNDEAKKLKLILRVNQAFRRHGVPPSGAVVTPATKSQHLVGHAVDVNIVDGSTVNTSDMFNNGTETDDADKFIAAVKGQGLRWGGDFSDTDPPHFDDLLPPNGEDYEMTFFFAQRCFEKNHPMRLAT